MDFFILASSPSFDIKDLEDRLNRLDVTIKCVVINSHEEHYYVHQKGKLICEYFKRKLGPSLSEHSIAISFRNKKHRKPENTDTPKLNDLCGPAKRQELYELTKRIEEAYQLKHIHVANAMKNNTK